MQLEKWYMDFVTPDGKACLCYSARLQYKGLSIGYSSLVKGEPDKPFEAQYSLKAFDPDISSSHLEWKPPKGNSQFLWSRNLSDQPKPMTLWQSQKGSVIWHNIMPNANAHMVCQDGELKGLGYVEKLNLTILPWKLPLKRLRWGRFVSETFALSWIHWELRDGETRQWVLENGLLVHGATVGDQVISWHGNVLQFDEGSVIRKGFLKETAFSSLPFLNQFLPSAVINIHEYKRLAKARVVLSEGSLKEGWVIDETVIFP